MVIIGKWFNTLHKINKSISRNPINQFIENETEFTDNKNIINIGSGGDVADLIKKLIAPSSKLTQIDISADRNPDIVADACNLHMIADNSVDIVYLIEVLEHIPTPDKAVFEIHRILKKGGKLIMSTPFIFPIHDEPYDYYRYTKFGLKHLLSAFNDVTIIERNDACHAILLLQGRMILTSNRISKLTAMIAYSLELLFYPLTLIKAKLTNNYRITTGYLTVAIK